MSDHQGYWSGMPAKTKARLTILVVYLVVALVVFSQNPILGTLLLVLPILATVFMLWLSGETGHGFGPFSDRKDSVLGYTMRYLWNRSAFTRSVLAVGGFIAVVGGLGWLSTEDMRAEAAKPTLTERAASVAESATEATKETASGWFDTAKGWFTSEE